MTLCRAIPRTTTSLGGPLNTDIPVYISCNTVIFQIVFLYSLTIADQVKRYNCILYTIPNIKYIRVYRLLSLYFNCILNSLRFFLFL